MMEFVRWLIFIKIVSQVVKGLKKIVIKKGRIEIKQDCDKKGYNKEDCDKRKIL